MKRSLAVLILFMLCGARCIAAPSAAFVIDVRDGTVYHAEDADRRLHPASLTKMMTLYLAFEAIEREGLDPDLPVTVSANAAAEGGSSLGLRTGQVITIRHLIRAVAVRSANDAATALAEAIAGSEPAFLERMNARAADIGMTGTSFRNAHGLTQEGHLSTARDMSLLGRQLWFDYPDYWNLFSRLSADAGVATVAHTNRRFLTSYSGADGIKTGYTRAAGFNLTASAARGEARLIVTVFGASSSAARAAKVGRLMDDAFARAPDLVDLRPPEGPARPAANPDFVAMKGGWMTPAVAPLIGQGTAPLHGRRTHGPRDGGIASMRGRQPRPEGFRGSAPPGGLALTTFGG